MGKVISWIKNHKRGAVAVASGMMATTMMAVGVSAADPGTGGVSADLGTFITAIKGALADFTTTNLSTILIAALSVTVGLAIAWFAFRFIKRKISGAMKSGRL